MSKDEMDDWNEDGEGGDGGWDEDAGGGDDDWGDSKGGATDEWDDAAFEDDAMAADDADTASAELSLDIQIANIFYEAEDIQRENPKLALEKFQQVRELAKVNTEKINDESRTSLFASLVHIVVLSYQTGAVKAMIDYYKELLSMIPKVTRNEGADAIDTVLNTVANSTDFELLETIYSVTSQQLALLPETEKMVFNVKMKLCKVYLEREDYQRASLTLDQLHSLCRLADGSDDRRAKGSELIEIYALKIKISFATHDQLKMKSLYEATKDLSAAVKDPRSQSIIREMWGFMFGESQQWSRAYTEFYQAFIHYQEIGNRDKAKQCLQYVVIANMLAGGEQNPFDAREAKVYQNDGDIQAIVGLRLAYEKCDVSNFNKYLGEIKSVSAAKRETFIPSNLTIIIKDFQCRAILNISKSYRRMRFSHVANLLQVDEATIEKLVVGLILDGQLVASIDKVNGIIALTEATVHDKRREEAIDAWISAISHLRKHVTEAAHSA